MKVGRNVRWSIATNFIGILSVVKMPKTLKQESDEVLVVGGCKDGGRQMTHISPQLN